MNAREEFGGFLRAARARTAPATVSGLRSSGADPRQRRVKGLRREEVAQLAGVSFDYYTRLEQGRVGHVSDAVLRGVADALRLDEAERRYLRDLTEGPRRRAGTSPSRRERVRPTIRHLVDAFSDVSVMVTGRGMDVLAVNKLAAEIFFDPAAAPAAERNLAVWTFLDPAARQRYVEWQRIAQGMVHGLRLQAAGNPGDARVAEVIATLRERSADFRVMWAKPGAFECTLARMVMRHPAVGEFRLDCEAFPVPGDAVQKMNVHSAPAGSPADGKLAELRGLLV
ncbi:helix-turn-helix domain-containing protein [Actinoplanes sp. TBRC 11911]|uniref:helix-turn-helix transcriptional regulator n=1 Tax=Actinoplanes sp. TBRC 11911 TaxID=2729386 RepID=UPI00145F41FD|nr:helix-turn-helix transcriptional regulator [Actinoplanes sp. TBRC 11911]NMO53605.1 helix-turn-helix domain-containing protein [Actinoplanes sp. TBRC 11911]